MNPKNKNQQENWEEKLTQFLLSEEILFKNEIGDGWIKISEGKQLTGEYQKIINKVAQLLKSEKDRWRRRDISLCSADILRAQEIERNKCKSEKEKLIERIKKIKSPIMKEEYFRELPSLKGIWYAGFSTGKKIILKKLKKP